MSLDAWNKITQTNDLFKKIITPLKEHLRINIKWGFKLNVIRTNDIKIAFSRIAPEIKN